MSCLFCETFEKRTGFIYENESVYAIYDNFPVTKGHILIITKRHVPNYFGINKQELLDIDQAISESKKIIDLKYKPTGYNLGINNGVSAGQTIMHLHIHLIPRYDSDCLDPCGGVRGVIPEKQKY